MTGYDRNGMCKDCGGKAGEHERCAWGSELIPPSNFGMSSAAILQWGKQ